MSGISKLDLSTSGPLEPVPPRPSQAKKVISIVLSTLMALGMILSYALGAPWPVLLLFFALGLASSWPLSRKVEQQREITFEFLNHI